MAYTENSEKLDSASVVERAKKLFELCEDYWHEIYKAAEDDLKFRSGDQWPEALKRQRDKKNQPSLVINKTNQAVRQVTNDQRQNRPAIKVSPVDDLADVETAEKRQGIIRHIEYKSGADAAYDTGFEAAATGGIGFWRVVTDYCDPLSFDQDILIKRVPNFLSIYLDPSFQEADGSDACFGFVVDKMPRSKFKAEYPKAALAKNDEWQMLSDASDGWVDESECRVVEFYEKSFEEKELYLLSDGNSVLKEELEEIQASLGGLPQGIEILQVRKSLIPSIKWYKIAGNEVLDQTDIPGEYIPIIPTLGAEYYIDGKRVLEGIVRPTKDPQKMYNYWASSETETIALAPKAPYIGVEGQFEGHHEWEDANTTSYSYLEYKPVSLDGQTPAPPPQRNVYEPPVQAITNARMLASDDLKAASGIYDAALGAKSNETSGIAIQRRNMQAQTANFHLIDNLTRSIRHTGRIINSWIPTYYDGPRVARIIGEEGQEEVIKLNQEFQYKGEMKTFRMDVGKYDVAVDTGPSFATKRQEAVETMLELSKAMPEQASLFMDLMVKNMDLPGSQEIAERLRKTLPPGIAEDKDKKPVPPEVQAQLQQQAQMIDGLTQQLNQTKDELSQKKTELESKERIEFSKQQVDLQKKIAELEQKDSALLLQTQVGQIQAMQQMQAKMAELSQRLDLVGMNEPVEQQPNLENEMELGGNMPASAPMDQPPTGGISPGNNMGV